MVKVPKAEIQIDVGLPKIPVDTGAGVGHGTSVGACAGNGVDNDATICIGGQDITAVNVPEIPGTRASIVAVPLLVTTFTVMI